MSAGTKRRGRGGRAGGGRDADRSLRQKAEKASAYLDSSDEEDETLKQTFDVHEKLKNTKKFAQFFVKELEGEQVNLAYFQRTGFTVPMLVRKKAGLGITAPEADSFTVTDVKNAVGARRTIDVMDCTTQRNSEMTMKEFEEYFNSPDGRDGRKLNVISLEFSFTKLEPYVIAPKVVRQIDWTDNVWPRHLKEQQTEGTNDLREMKYPKVQKYCLMSVAGCYTDFHVDFGGTSVWYHIVKGKKVFWLIPPTETNLKTYEQWTLSGKQSDVFFGDLVEKCGMVTLESGNTFFIPSGWIHAVYTPADSLVFGGNFLHSFAIEKQIRIAQIEEITKVPQKFRFPFFTELQWYALDKYIFHLLGRSHLVLDTDVKTKLFGPKNEREAYIETIEHPNITPQELFGLKAIIMYIHALAVSKKNVPALIHEPINLVRDVRIIVDDHKGDDANLSVTGKPLLHWPGIKNDPGFMRVNSRGELHRGVGRPPAGIKKERGSKEGKKDKGSQKKDRVPCKICQACISQDCGKCPHCSDMPRFGGSGRLRQPCQLRTCLQPLLVTSTLCHICALDGWYAEKNMTLVDRPPGTNALMECSLCHEVTHPTCMTDYGVEGYIKMDLPNSWECPKCVKGGQATKLEPETPTNGNGHAPVVNGDGATPAKLLKSENGEPVPLKRAMSYGSDTAFTGYQLFSVKGTSDQPKQELREQLAGQIMSASTQAHKEGPYVFRPPPTILSAEEIYERREKEPVDLKLERGVMLSVFKKLNTDDLARVVVVCKAWSKIIQDPALWTTVKLTHTKMTSQLLSLILLRQPIKLRLDWSTLSKQQLTWLLPRIQQTRSLSLRGSEYGSAVSALSTVNCPMLTELDLGAVSNLADISLYRLLSAPKDSRPGTLDKKSRLKLLSKLDLSDTEISDVSLRYLTQYLAQLSDLNISGCWKVTDAGLAQLGSGDNNKMAESLKTLDLSGCKGITNGGLAHLVRCQNLVKVNCSRTAVTSEGARKFVEASKHKLRSRSAQGGLIIEPKPMKS